jgi:hypothetical protein
MRLILERTAPVPTGYERHRTRWIRPAMRVTAAEPLRSRTGRNPTAAEPAGIARAARSVCIGRG